MQKIEEIWPNKGLDHHIEAHLELPLTRMHESTLLIIVSHGFDVILI